MTAPRPIDAANAQAPELAEPPADGPAGSAIRRAATVSAIFIALWTAMFLGMIVSVALADPFFSAMAAGIYGLGMYILVPQQRQIRAGMTGALVREAVVVVERRQEGRDRGRYVLVVENRGGGRRKLVVLADTGEAMPGEAGVAFSRGGFLWAFHRVAAPAA